MSDQPPGASPDQPSQPSQQPSPEPPAYQSQPYAQQPYGQVPLGQVPYGPGGSAQVAPYQGGAPVGEVRNTGLCIVLFIVTLGFYSWYWWYKVHDDMKRHTGTGLGGGIALLLAILVSIVMPYLTSSEAGQLYSRRGQRPPVTGLTGLWYFPGVLILVGPFIWFIQTNNAINEYWRSLGAVG